MVPDLLSFLLAAQSVASLYSELPAFLVITRVYRQPLLAAATLPRRRVALDPAAAASQTASAALHEVFGKHTALPVCDTSCACKSGV
jgi:hypothetical protein